MEWNNPLRPWSLTLSLTGLALFLFLVVSSSSAQAYSHNQGSALQAIVLLVALVMRPRGPVDPGRITITTYSWFNSKGMDPAIRSSPQCKQGDLPLKFNLPYEMMDLLNVLKKE